MVGISISRPTIGPPQQRDNLVISTAKRLLSWHEKCYQTTSPTRASSVDETIRIVCISDTHNTHPTLPNGDILLHAGDLTQYGTFAELQNQLDWLRGQPHQTKIVIGGNHDLVLDASFVERYPDREVGRREDLEWGEVIYYRMRAPRSRFSCRGRRR